LGKVGRALRPESPTLCSDFVTLIYEYPDAELIVSGNHC
jgi:hypothetical protein